MMSIRRFGPWQFCPETLTLTTEGHSQHHEPRVAQLLLPYRTAWSPGVADSDPTRRTIAVLPFTTSDPDRDAAYLAEGVAGSLSTRVMPPVMKRWRKSCIFIRASTRKAWR